MPLDQGVYRMAARRYNNFAFFSSIIFHIVS